MSSGQGTSGRALRESCERTLRRVIDVQLPHWPVLAASKDDGARPTLPTPPLTCILRALGPQHGPCHVAYSWLCVHCAAMAILGNYKKAKKIKKVK